MRVGSFGGGGVPSGMTLLSVKLHRQLEARQAASLASRRVLTNEYDLLIKNQVMYMEQAKIRHDLEMVRLRTNPLRVRMPSETDVQEPKRQQQIETVGLSVSMAKEQQEVQEPVGRSQRDGTLSDTSLQTQGWYIIPARPGI